MGEDGQLDIGLDLSILKGRLNVTFDYYYKRTTDLLRKQYLSPSTGFDTVWVNDGEIRNKGFEVAVTGHIVSTKDWNFSATGIFSLNRNKVCRSARPRTRAVRSMPTASVIRSTAAAFTTTPSSTCWPSATPSIRSTVTW